MGARPIRAGDLNGANTQSWRQPIRVSGNSPRATDPGYAQPDQEGCEIPKEEFRNGNTAITIPLWQHGDAHQVEKDGKVILHMAPEPTVRKPQQTADEGKCDHQADPAAAHPTVPWEGRGKAEKIAIIIQIKKLFPFDSNWLQFVGRFFLKNFPISKFRKRFVR